MKDAKFTTNVIIKSIQVILEEKKKKERKGLGKDGEERGMKEGKKRERERRRKGWRQAGELDP